MAVIYAREKKWISPAASPAAASPPWRRTLLDTASLSQSSPNAHRILQQFLAVYVQLGLQPCSLVAFSRPQAKYGFLGHFFSLPTFKRVERVILVFPMYRCACTRKRMHRRNTNTSISGSVERVIEAVIVI